MKMWPTTIENKWFIIKAVMPPQYFGTVHLECSTVAATVLWFRESFFSPLCSTLLIIPPKVFFFFFLLNIDVSWHLYCYTDTINFTIFSQLLTCQFFTSRNKIIKYEIEANHNWKQMFKKNFTTLIVITIFSQLSKS